MLISCQPNQKFPFLLFPLKSPGVLIMLAYSGRTMVGVGFCLCEAYLCSCRKERIRYTLLSAWKLLVKTCKNPLHSKFLAYFRPSSRHDFLQQKQIVFSFVVGRTQVRLEKELSKTVEHYWQLLENLVAKILMKRRICGPVESGF